MLCKKCKDNWIIWWCSFTKYFCEICNNEKTHHMTCVPKICDECSEKYKKCERCSKKLNIEEIENYFFEKWNSKIIFFRIWDSKKNIMIYNDNNYYLSLWWDLFHKKISFLSWIRKMNFTGFFDSLRKRIFEWDYVNISWLEWLVVFHENQYKVLIKTKFIKIEENKHKIVIWNLFEWKINKKEI